MNRIGVPLQSLLPDSFRHLIIQNDIAALSAASSIDSSRLKGQSCASARKLLIKG